MIFCIQDQSKLFSFLSFLLYTERECGAFLLKDHKQERFVIQMSVAVRFFCLFESGLLSFKGGGFGNIMKFLKPMQ